MTQEHSRLTTLELEKRHHDAVAKVEEHERLMRSVIRRSPKQTLKMRARLAILRSARDSLRRELDGRGE